MTMNGWITTERGRHQSRREDGEDEGKAQARERHLHFGVLAADLGTDARGSGSAPMAAVVAHRGQGCDRPLALMTAARCRCSRGSRPAPRRF
jgi:hypothetical protein